MAYCKTIQKQIKSEQYMIDALEYITNPAKASHISYITQSIVCKDTDPQRIASEYKITRTLANKQKGILAHHLIQSFSKDDNLTPELAHQIGIELINRCLSDYQVTLATHIDGNCLHNHIMINSVSPVTQKKFAGNQTTLKHIRQTSDDICLCHNLDIVTPGFQSKYSGLDNETMQAAKKGKSWKVQLVKDLDEAFINCNNKNDFVKFFNKKNYEVKFTAKNITFKKSGYDKSIRADTLAKQFGNKYSKASIENKLNINIEKIGNKVSVAQKSKYNQRIKLNQFAVNEWKKQERIQAQKYKPYNYNSFSKVLFSKNPTRFTLLLIFCLFRNCKKKQVANYKTLKKQKYKIKSYSDFEKKKQLVGNISFNRLVNSAGKTAEVKLYNWQIAKLLDNNILFAAKIDLLTGTALVTVKDFDLNRVANVLNISEETLKGQSKTINNRRVIYKINKQPKDTIEYLVISKELCDKLNSFSLDIAKYPRKDGKINIGFSSQDKDKILTVLFPERKESKKDSFYLRNVKINRELKEYSKRNGIKLSYKIVVNSQYAKLKSCNIKFAVFKQKDGRYNIVFLETDKKAINKLIGGDKKTTEKKSKSNVLKL